MAELTVLYWRDIPAQVVAKAGRKSARAELPKRFTEAIDAAAMRAGTTGSDEYLAAWHRSEPAPCADDLDQAVAAAVTALDGTYGPDRLKRLVENGGNEPTGA
jgi:hypothetical protein